MIVDEEIKSIVLYLKNSTNIVSLLLGGSRAKGNAKKKSDYDLFAIIKTDDFRSYREQFVQFLEQCPNICYAANMVYVENWGYLFKAVGVYCNEKIFLDIAIIPFERISEMALRQFNIIIFDKSNSVQSYIMANKEMKFDSGDLEPKRKLDYVKLFGFEYMRYCNSVENRDYSLAMKAFEKMKVYYMRYKRIKFQKYANVQHCPEKRFCIDFPEDPIVAQLWDDNTRLTISEAYEKLIKEFYALVEEKEILDFFFSQKA